MKIQTSIDSCLFVPCIPAVFGFQTWLQMLSQWYANISLIVINCVLVIPKTWRISKAEVFLIVASHKAILVLIPREI